MTTKQQIALASELREIAVVKKVIAADERAVMSEQRAITAEKKIIAAEEMAMRFQIRANNAESDCAHLNAKIFDITKDLNKARESAKIADQRASAAESRATISEERASNAEKRAVVMEARAISNEQRVLEAEEALLKVQNDKESLEVQIVTYNENCKAAQQQILEFKKCLAAAKDGKEIAVKSLELKAEEQSHIYAAKISDLIQKNEALNAKVMLLEKMTYDRTMLHKLATDEEKVPIAESYGITSKKSNIADSIQRVLKSDEVSATGANNRANIKAADAIIKVLNKKYLFICIILTQSCDQSFYLAHCLGIMYIMDHFILF